MTMSEPPPINYQTNPNYNVAKADFDYSAPLSPSGSNYPCKGHLKDLDAPEGKPVRTYAQGGTYNMVYVLIETLVYPNIPKRVLT